MQNNKEDYIYSLCYKNQIVYFLDDSNFQDDNSDVEFELSMSLPRMSEMSDYIEEYNNNFLDKLDYNNEGIVSIPCLIKKYPANKKPFIINNDESSLFLTENKVGLSNHIDGRNFISVKYVLNLDVTKPFEKISKDLKKLEIDNPFFSLYEYLEGVININNDKYLKTYISSIRMDILENRDIQFMILEYYYLRRFLRANKEQTKTTIDEIYGLDYKKSRF